MDGKFVSYLRVGPEKHGRFGPGLEVQQAAVTAFLNGGQWELLAEYQEPESGKNDARPELQKAIELCRRTGAVLLVAELDRLSRNAAFLLSLSKSGIEIRCCDMPEANTMMFGIMAAVVQHERKMTRKRTRQSLAAAKA